jgi:FkbM family methyltransferase
MCSQTSEIIYHKIKSGTSAIKKINILSLPWHKLIIHKIKSGILAIRKIKNWHIFILDHFKLIDSEYMVYKLRNGVLYKTHSKELHRYMITESWIHNCYTKYFKVKENYVVFDIGANMGAFTMLAAFYAKKGKVYSFEPEEENFKLLEENIKLNNFNNIKATRKAVSNKKEERDFFLSNTNVGGHSFYSSRGDKRIKIQTISFEDFIKENKIEKIDFLKLDCEGGSMTFFITARRVLSRK